MKALSKQLILLMLTGVALLGPLTVRAASYQQALDDYNDQRYSRSYKKAMNLVREKKGARRNKALVLAAAAVLELDREEKARVLFKKALNEDPDLELPEVVRSRRAQRFFAEVRDGREPRSDIVRGETEDSGFDRWETYWPFGFNQLQQDKIFLGLTLGAAQGLGLYYAAIKAKEANRIEQETATIRQRAIQSGDDINPVFLNLVAQNKQLSQRSKQSSQLSLGLAAIAYGTSVLEAGLRAPANLALVATQYESIHIQIALLNPLHAFHGLQLSLRF